MNINLPNNTYYKDGILINTNRLKKSNKCKNCDVYQDQIKELKKELEDALKRIDELSSK